MRTKNEALDFLRGELESGNAIVIATLGNGGAGLTLVQESEEESINDFIEGLKECEYDGEVEASADISECEYFNEDSIVYQFSDGTGFSTQVLGWNTYDVHFNNESSSNNKGFFDTSSDCRDYISQNNGTNESYFADYKGGTVSIVCNETGEVLFETEVL